MTRGRRALNGLDDDIRDHIERETQENIELGMTPEEAHRQAMLRFGNVARVKEDARAVWIWPRFDDLWNTARVAARTWSPTPVLATAFIVSLPPGLGGSP